ncbi:MAG TPA: glutamate formimidoyltransferase [Bacteroidales bacterium]|jgi:glutamate formiminotransferase/formiminotetrahydrofolate cyclodeaminase|nr:glutamate formimidoyltransferase [Bacteroidales bacterium]HRS18931.1 glutamate formimidoyltransferase [Bacteroidales bacterium]
MELIECVPNISEGCNSELIEQIAKVISSVSGVKLLHIDAGKAANRTVYTFVGFPESVVEAAFNMFEFVIKHIDMAQHTGTHPRIGAVDVCPLIPIQGISLEQTKQYAEQLAKRVGEELHVPVYLYEQNAKYIHRTRLEQIRSGEYEGFSQKMQSEGWDPDYGPHVFNPKTGASVIGARNFLLAYNINLVSSDVTIAKHIAARIRESGGNYTDMFGKKHVSKGLLRGVKAIGWYIPEYDVVQVSTNITDFNLVSMYKVYCEVQKLAIQYGTNVRGSELIGLVPYDALHNAGKEILQQKPSVANDTIQAAIQELGLQDVKEFTPQKQILEYVAGVL